ncbi:hypothetical protein J2S38_002579 [Mycolicibacterium senegalense]|nr:hypothetical protein [Mycolicibacterium senegalense]
MGVVTETDTPHVGARTATDETSESVGRHHTKDKGDLGVAKAHADLVAKGFYVLFPATEHAPFDLVAYAAGTFHPYLGVMGRGRATDARQSPPLPPEAD